MATQNYNLPTIEGEDRIALVAAFNGLAESTDAALKQVSDTAAPYTLPAATPTVLGGVKVGGSLTVLADGTINVDWTKDPNTGGGGGGSTPGNNSITTAMIQDGAITSAKLSTAVAQDIADGKGAASAASSAQSTASAAQTTATNASNSVANVKTSLNTAPTSTTLATNVYAIKRNGWVSLNFDDYTSSNYNSGAATAYTLGTLPVGYRPTKEVRGTINVMTGTTIGVGVVKITTAGTVSYFVHFPTGQFPADGTTGDFNGEITFPTNDSIV